MRKAVCVKEKRPEGLIKIVNYKKRKLHEESSLCKGKEARGNYMRKETCVTVKIRRAC